MPASKYVTKNVNQDYFNLEGKTDDELKRRYYVWGAFLAGYTPVLTEGIEFRSRHPELIEIVRRELEIEHKVRSNEGHSYFIRIEKAPKLRSALEEIGLTADKYKRRFPNIPVEYMQPLIRGFTDQRAVIYETDRGTARISIAFGKLLLEGFNRALVEHAGVKRGPSGRNLIEYAIYDTIRIHNYIYSDWDFIQQNGLYVPVNKQMLEINVNRNVPVHHSRRDAMDRINRSKSYLLKGYTATKSGKKVGYKHPSNFMQAFNNATGQTTTKFRKLNFRLEPSNSFTINLCSIRNLKNSKQ